MTDSINNSGIVGFTQDWQEPAATEKYAYEAIASQQEAREFIYFAFPWATLIDAIDVWNMSLSNKLLLQLKKLQFTHHPDQKVVTVCQHIKLKEYIELFKKIGITDIFWPHKIKNEDEISGIHIHPFPLFPAQTYYLEEKPTGKPSDILNRPYLANFIGAYSPNLYLSEVRQHIINDKDKFTDILIIDRANWHFDRSVYQEQMKGISPGQKDKEYEESRKQEYLNAILNSKFTLCPTGAGPNSIRIFESIELLSIPVILTRDLALPGPKDLWEKACLIVDDNQLGYQEALKRMRKLDDNEILEKEFWLRKLREQVIPNSYSKLIRAYS